MRFESEHRSHILTHVLQQYSAFSKSHQSENMERAVVEFRNVRKYRYLNIEGVNSISVRFIVSHFF